MIDKINGNGNYDISSGSKDAVRKRAEELRKKRSASRNQEDAGVILDLSGKTAGKKKEAEAVRRKQASSWTDTLRRLIHPLVRWIKDFWESDRPDPKEAGAQASEMSAASDPEQAADGTLEDAASEIKAGEILEGADSELTAAESLEGTAFELTATDSLEGTASELTAAEALERADFKLAVDEMWPAASGDDLPPLDGLGSGNLRQIEQYVTRNGTKRLAHHSDLLTYYDRRGKFVEIDETEKHRVLFGDKHVLKL